VPSRRSFLFVDLTGRLVYHYPRQLCRGIAVALPVTSFAQVFAMGKKHPRPAPAPTQASSPEWSGWKWIVVLILSVGVGYGATVGYSKARRWLNRTERIETTQPSAEAPLGPQPRPDGPAPAGMVWIPGGTFRMGTNEQHPHFADAYPEHDVEVGGFWMDETEVTNAQFAEFVKATGYVTVAEQKPTLESIRAGLPPGDKDPDPEILVPGGLVFTPPLGPVPNHYSNWWKWVPGASWRHPEGPGSEIANRMNHPVVQVSWGDAVAYARWAGKRLPTEAEWEFAARGGLVGKTYAWGDEPPNEGGKWRCNIFQGSFPWNNTLEDGYLRTAPVKSYPPNPFGLYDVAGNVWEWCRDWYRPDYYSVAPRRNPQGPESSYDPTEANPLVPKRVTRGGSFLCSDGFCSRYKPYGRGRDEMESGQSHLGFRCVKDAK
jgi:sulfatase modifying factor 1